MNKVARKRINKSESSILKINYCWGGPDQVIQSYWARHISENGQFNAPSTAEKELPMSPAKGEYIP